MGRPKGWPTTPPETDGESRFWSYPTKGASAQMNRDNGRTVPPGSIDTFLNHGPTLAALSIKPFRGYRTTDYEGGVAAPLIASWPPGLKGK